MHLLLSVWIYAERIVDKQYVADKKTSGASEFRCPAGYLYVLKI